MQFLPTRLPGVVEIEPRVFGDVRGFFLETYHKPRFEAAGIHLEFVQDNHSRSIEGTLRGLHYQLRYPQGKLVRAIRGEIFDVAVDLRRHSPTFGQWTGTVLSEANRRQLYIPPGCAHGFCVLGEMAEVIYKCTEIYHPEDEHTLLWNDPDIGIDWPIPSPLLSEKDRQGRRFAEAAVYE